MEEQTKAKILVRLKSIEGHVRGVARMVEEGAYCVDILQQIVAIQSALDKARSLILENHLHTCVTTAIRGEKQEERERVIGELLDLFEASSKL